jgi:ribosomal protein L4
MRTKALFMALSRKLKDGEIVFVDSIEMKEPKTATARKTLAALSGISGFEKLTTKRANAALIALSAPTEAIKKSYRNISNISCMSVRDLNPVAVLGSSYLILENPEAGLKALETRLASKGTTKPARASK